jgi:hypothetical protein
MNRDRVKDRPGHAERLNGLLDAELAVEMRDLGAAVSAGHRTEHDLLAPGVRGGLQDRSRLASFGLRACFEWCAHQEHAVSAAARRP